MNDLAFYFMSVALFMYSSNSTVRTGGGVYTDKMLRHVMPHDKMPRTVCHQTKCHLD